MRKVLNKKEIFRGLAAEEQKTGELKRALPGYFFLQCLNVSIASLAN